ncbi:MAG TPA: stage II sporulation protein M [archaeon]|nr:stage II sporulation protein M [archaeon]
MVLDRAVERSLLEHKPDVAAIIGFLFVLVGFLSALFMFSAAISVAMIGLSSMLMVPYVMKIVKPDEPSYASVFGKRNKSIAFYGFLFLGMAVAYTLLFGVLNPALLERTFGVQLDAISVTISGRFWSPGIYLGIVANNLLIVCIAILLSFVYGTGAVFILNYNASIAGVVYGSSLNALLWGGIPLFAHPLAYLPHTIIEITAYLLAALCGNIITKPMRGKRSPIPRDAALLLGLSLGLIFLGGWVELVVPPLLS